MTAEHPLSRRGAVLTLIAIVAIVSATAIAHVWTHLRVIEYGYRISKSTRERDKLLERNRRLRVELAVLKSPARVTRVAVDQISLRPAEPHQVRRIRLPSGDRSRDESSGGARSGSPVAASTHSRVREQTLAATEPLRVALGSSGLRDGQPAPVERRR